MNRRSRFFRFRLMSGIGALVVGIALFAVPSQAAHADGGGCDCYVVTPATNPAPAGAGTGDVYAFQVTNNDPNEHLVSLTFSAPTDFVITGASVITSASGPSGTTFPALPGSSVTLDLPNEPTGSTFTVDVTAQTPCMAASSEVWGVSGVDSLGETNEVKWSSSPLSVSVTGTCSLAFTGQPAQTAVNSDILTGFNSTGSPLTVQLRDASGAPLNSANFSASGTPVTVSIQANPVGGTLSGTTTADSSKGVADFRNLQINKAGVGYNLAANATGFPPATSSFFTIAGQIQACGTGSCTASQSTATTATSATASSAQGDYVALGLGGVTLACNHYTAVSDMAAFGVFNSSGGGVASSSAVVTLTLSKSAVESSPRPLVLWQVCYGSPTPFPSIPGTSGTTVIGGTTYNTGLLLPCILFPPGKTQPCFISQRYTATGGVQLTFIALGDPLYRG
jgi:hypothetical protein